MADTDFDVIVIGTGVAGQTASEELGAAGLRVAAVDRREFGGTCALRGCEPKKTLFAGADVTEQLAEHLGRGVVGEASVDWPALVAFKRRFTDPASKEIENAIQKSPAKAIHGEARFVSPDAIEVDGTRYTARHFVVATGAKPVPLHIDGEDCLTDSEQFMAFQQRLPKQVVFVGGGYISFEFAHMAAAAGSKVTILHRSDRVLKNFDADLSRMLVDAYREEGIDVRVNTPVSAIRRKGSTGYEVVCVDGSTHAAGMVVHGAGRVPELEALELEVADVRFGAKGIEVDSYMRSVTNPRVWSAGDAVARGPELTPVAIRQARAIVKNILAPGPCVKFEPAVIPSVCFSHPPLASAGLSVDETQRKAIDVEVKFHDTTTWESSQRVGVRRSGAKLLLEPGTGRLLGAHLLGPHAEEVINVFAAAILCKMTSEQIRAAHWGYPTFSSEIVYMV